MRKKIKKIKKPKKPSKTKLKLKADKVFSEYIRKRDGLCRNCGSQIGLQCAHIISRSYHTTRWDVDNAVALCHGCHLFYTYHPIEWELWVTKQFGEKKYDELKQRALQHHIMDYEQIILRIASYQTDGV